MRINRLNIHIHFLLSLVLILPFTTPATAVDFRPTVDSLLGQFDVVAFGDGQGQRSGRVIRWESSILIRVVGNAKRLHREILRRHSHLVEELTGRSINFTTHPEQMENVRVVFLPALEMARLPGVSIDQKVLDLLAAPRGCYFLIFLDQQGVIERSVIVVNSDRDSASIYHCLLEELIQSMGLPNDTNLIRPSIFSDKDQLAKISRGDEVLIRTLYDPRMVTGMEKSEAMEIARIVIADWDARLPHR